MKYKKKQSLGVEVILKDAKQQIIQEGVFHLHLPEDNVASVPLILDSPHSGRSYPGDFGSIVPEFHLRRYEDSYVDKLFEAAPELGASFLVADFPRSYIDPNRSPDDIDPSMLADEWEGDINPSEKARVGHGLIWRSCPMHGAMYSGKIPSSLIRHRLENYWYPYHQQLEEEIARIYAHWGEVWHINCHSMPSASSPMMLRKDGSRRKADFILGDREATSASRDFTNMVRASLQNMGYSVGLNYPYKGAEIVKRYGHPAQGRHSLQIEINRNLYIDEMSLKHKRGFSILQADLTQLITEVRAYLLDHIRLQAAE